MDINKFNYLLLKQSDVPEALPILQKAKWHFVIGKSVRSSEILKLVDSHTKMIWGEGAN